MSKPKLTKAMRRVLERMERCVVIESTWWVVFGDTGQAMKVSSHANSNIDSLSSLAWERLINRTVLDFKGEVFRIYRITTAGRRALKEN